MRVIERQSILVKEEIEDMVLFHLYIIQKLFDRRRNRMREKKTK